MFLILFLFKGVILKLLVPAVPNTDILWGGMRLVLERVYMFMGRPAPKELNASGVREKEAYKSRTELYPIEKPLYCKSKPFKADPCLIRISVSIILLFRHWTTGSKCLS